MQNNQCETQSKLHTTAYFPMPLIKYSPEYLHVSFMTNVIIYKY